MAESGLQRKALPGFDCPCGSGGLIVAAQVARARPGLDLAHPGARSRHGNQSAGSRLELVCWRSSRPTVSEASVDPAGAVWIQASAASLKRPGPPGDHGAGEALTTTCLVVGHGSSSSIGVRFKGLPRQLGS